MKKVFSLALLTVFVTCFSNATFATQNGETQKPKVVVDDTKSQTSGTSSALTSSASTETGSSAPKPEFNDPNSTAATEAQKQYDSALALSDAGRFDEAIDAFKLSLKQRPDDPQTNFSMGMTYSRTKSYKQAFDSFKRAVRLKPDWPEAHLRLGMMAYVLGRTNQAADEYKKLVQMHSPLATVLYRIIKDENARGIAEESAKGPTADPAKRAVSTPATINPNTAGLTAGSRPDEVQPNANLSPSSRNPNQAAKTPPVESTSRLNEETAKTTEPNSPPLTEIYRVGVGDVLDIRFLNSPVGRSTLFTVIAGGFIDLPLAGGSISVGGLTVNEIQNRIAAELKRRAIEDGTQVSVGVRQYSSHSIMVTGLVVNPGTRILRREAVPLYVVLAESQLRNDAGRVTIMRGGTPGQILDLSNPTTLNVSVVSGDVISVSGRPQEFYYIAGRINYPGQKVFLPGITLVQAILAAGGTQRQNEKIVEIAREGADHRLVTTRFNIKEIKLGKAEDPKLQAGDRIEVLH